VNHIEWRVEYEVGILEIDNQHKFFLGLINRIIDLEENVEIIDDYLDELLLYTKFHFKSEENIMKLRKYPNWVEHRKIHHDLISELSDLMTLTKMNNDSPKQILDFLINWFVIHTTSEDKKIAFFS